MGDRPGLRLDSFIHDIITNSTDKNDIIMSEPIARAMKDIRNFMFERVYTNPLAKAEEGKAEELMETLYDYFFHNKDRMPEEFLKLLDRGEKLEQVVCDYVGAMSDRFAINLYEDIFVPKSWQL